MSCLDLSLGFSLMDQETEMIQKLVTLQNPFNSQVSANLLPEPLDQTLTGVSFSRQTAENALDLSARFLFAGRGNATANEYTVKFLDKLSLRIDSNRYLLYNDEYQRTRATGT